MSQVTRIALWRCSQCICLCYCHCLCLCICLWLLYKVHLMVVEAVASATTTSVVEKAVSSSKISSVVELLVVERSSICCALSWWWWWWCKWWWWWWRWPCHLNINGGQSLCYDEMRFARSRVDGWDNCSNSCWRCIGDLKNWNIFKIKCTDNPHLLIQHFNI